LTTAAGAPQKRRNIHPLAFGVFLGFEILVQPSHPEGAAFENLSRGAT
jgi:hypothetical protein